MNQSHLISQFIYAQMLPGASQYIDEVYPGCGLCLHRIEKNKIELLTFRNSNHPYLYNNLFSMGFCPLKNLTDFFYLGLYDEGDIYYVKSQKMFYLRYDEKSEKNFKYCMDWYVPSDDWTMEALQRYIEFMKMPPLFVQSILGDNVSQIEVDYYFSVIAGIVEDLSEKEI